MSKQIQQSLQQCLSKIRSSNKRIQFRLRNCKRPKTPSFAIKSKRNEDDAVTLSDIDQFLFDNFRSLYQKEYDDSISNGKVDKTTAYLSPSLLDPPLLENFYSSKSPRMGEATTSSAGVTYDSSIDDEPEESTRAGPDDFIALLTYSSSPYRDFRLSMEEMVEARLEHNGRVDWEFMEELLFCYLDLNNNKSYRFILRAFVDLIGVLRENCGRIPACRQSSDGGNGWRHLKSN